MENMIFLKSLLDEYMHECKGKKSDKDMAAIEKVLDIVSADAMQDEFHIRLHGYE